MACALLSASCVALETPSGVEYNCLFRSWICPSSLTVASSCFTILLKALSAATFLFTA